MNGAFSVALGTTTPLVVDGETLAPRQLLVTSLFAPRRHTSGAPSLACDGGGGLRFRDCPLVPRLLRGDHRRRNIAGIDLLGQGQDELRQVKGFRLDRIFLQLPPGSEIEMTRVTQAMSGAEQPLGGRGSRCVSGDQGHPLPASRLEVRAAIPIDDPQNRTASTHPRKALDWRPQEGSLVFSGMFPTEPLRQSNVVNVRIRAQCAAGASSSFSIPGSAES